MTTNPTPHVREIHAALEAHAILTGGRAESRLRAILLGGTIGGFAVDTDEWHLGALAAVAHSIRLVEVDGDHAPMGLEGLALTVEGDLAVSAHNATEVSRTTGVARGAVVALDALRVFRLCWWIDGRFIG